MAVEGEHGSFSSFHWAREFDSGLMFSRSEKCLPYRRIILRWTFSIFNACTSKKITKPTEDVQNHVIQVGPERFGEGCFLVHFFQWGMFGNRCCGIHSRIWLIDLLIRRFCHNRDLDWDYLQEKITSESRTCENQHLHLHGGFKRIE